VVWAAGGDVLGEPVSDRRLRMLACKSGLVGTNREVLDFLRDPGEGNNND